MAKGNKFGTFGGVFTPSILTILGVIMYLRLPMIVGEAGLWATLGIILIAHIISITTGLSVSSIATDKKVEAGGTYYMISRSLGLPIGGTLGLALFVGLSFSVSLYLIGFAESFLAYWNYEVSINTIRIAGTLILIAVTTLTLISTSFAIKTQYFIMGAIVLSLISVLMGNHTFAPVVGITTESATKALPFMVLFGIFFPAVTGFEAGVSMSGDLQNPKKSIPLGSITAILVGLVVYLGLTFFLSYTVDHNLLANDPGVLLKISWVPALVIVGIWGATLSSALGSILGAPRILQATAIDKITPKIFAKGVGDSNEPRNALLLTFVIAEAGILIGDLDIIARIVSIFFITTYCFINLSCAFEAWTSADFRPSFKTPIWVSLFGALACFIVMIELDFIATLGASVVLGLLYLFLKRKELSLQSGDTWAGVWSSLAKTSLQHLSSSKQHTRNWRPNILMFNGADEARPYMMELGHALSGHLGLLSSFEIIHAKDAEGERPKLKEENADEIKKDFHYTYAARDIYGGIDEITRIFGFPGIEPNTVLLGWSKKAENKERFIKLISNIQQYNLNALFLYHHTVEKKSAKPTIDIWWSGWGRNLSLALNILRHLTRKDPWSRANIRLCIIINNTEDSDKISRYVRNLINEYRTTATVKIIDNQVARQSQEEIIQAESAATDLTIIGIPDNLYDDLETTFTFGNTICEQLQTVLFINASTTFEESSVITQKVTTDLAEKHEWVLPEIPISVYPELNIDIQTIDSHGQELVTQLHKKVFAPTLDKELSILKKMQSLSMTMAGTVEKSLKHEEPFQAKSAMMRAKKYFINQLQLTLDDVLANTLGHHEEGLKEGMAWYLEQLGYMKGSFPKTKTIYYNKEEFKRKENDDAATRWFKFIIRIFHPFAKKTIPLKIDYREGATYFFRDTRYHFLIVLLKDLEKNIQTLHNQLSQLISWTDNTFHSVVEAQGTPKAEDAVDVFSKQLKSRTTDLIEQATRLQSLYKGRLQTEYRKNVILFLHQLESIEFNSDIKRKKRAQKFYTEKQDQISNFPSQWETINRLEINTLKAQTFLFDFYGLAQQEMHLYNTRIKQFFAKEQQPIAELMETLKGIDAHTDGKRPALPDWDFDLEFAIETLQQTSEQLLTAARNIPDEMEIGINSEGDNEAINLPIRAMVAHLTETTLTGPVNDKIETVLEKIKRSSLIINDHASLAMFNVFNLKETDEEAIRNEEINTAVGFIQKEMETLNYLVDSILKAVEHQLTELKGALTITNLVDIAGDFSQLLRTQRKRRLQTKLSLNIDRIRERANKLFVNVLYSQTKGILLARQLSSPSQGLSVNEKLINVINSTKANPVVLQRLPHYYISLFSGRSSIGDNFWVARPKEEGEFALAYQRYQNGNQGIILVLGERNSGKTALCKRFAENTSSASTYHIFPPEEGSVSIDDFENVLQKATKFEGNASQILNLLPHNSVLILHDLELWWERSEEDGLALIRHIKSLIIHYAPKCLFVVNMNPFAFTVINTAEPLDLLCAGVVRCRPFNSFELKQLVMTRHKSSGLTIDFGSGAGDTFGEIKLARVFNQLFSYSKGNPGAAMNGWLLGINDFTNKSIVWKAPELPDDEVFMTMPEAWNHLLLQLLLHKRMGSKKIARCVQLDSHQIVKALQVMKRLQLLCTRGDSLYFINPTIEFLLVNHFKEKEWI